MYINEFGDAEFDPDEPNLSCVMVVEDHGKEMTVHKAPFNSDVVDGSRIVGEWRYDVSPERMEDFRRSLRSIMSPRKARALTVSSCA